HPNIRPDPSRCYASRASKANKKKKGRLRFAKPKRELPLEVSHVPTPPASGSFQPTCLYDLSKCFQKLEAPPMSGPWVGWTYFYIRSSGPRARWRATSTNFVSAAI